MRTVGAGNHSNTFCGVGATLIDSLDTLWLMGMRREFARARGWVAAELDTNRCAWLSAPLLGRVEAGIPLGALSQAPLGPGTLL